MFKRALLSVIILVFTITFAKAGSISNSAWLPSSCGGEPVTPVVDQSNVESYNKSIKIINEWQNKASSYNTCLINEANADNALIAKTANEEQSRFRAVIDKIKADTDAAKAKLEKQ